MKAYKLIVSQTAVSGHLASKGTGLAYNYAGVDNAGVDIDDLPHLKAWLKRIADRPAVSKGLDIPEENFVKAQLRDPKKKEELVEQSKKFVTTDK